MRFDVVYFINSSLPQTLQNRCATINNVHTTFFESRPVSRNGYNHNHSCCRPARRDCVAIAAAAAAAVSDSITEPAFSSTSPNNRHHHHHRHHRSPEVSIIDVVLTTSYDISYPPLFRRTVRNLWMCWRAQFLLYYSSINEHFWPLLVNATVTILYCSKVFS